MNLSSDFVDIVIAGAGLGGATIAATLCASETVLVLEAGNTPGHVYRAASSIGSGICSPLMSRRARPIWRMETAVRALTSLRSQTKSSSLFSTGGILKPAQSKEQATEFRDASRRWPQHGRWVDASEACRVWPLIRAPFGVLHVLSGASVSMGEWTSHLLDYAVSCGARRAAGSQLLAWRERGDISIRFRTSNGEVRTVRTARLILALGADYLRFSDLAALNLHPIKGQWVRVAARDVAPGSARSSFPVTALSAAPELLPVSGAGYVTSDDSGFTLGSTFEHDYRHLRPTAEATREIVANAARMIPVLALSEIRESGAALRVTVPGIRLPMVGPLRKGSNVWIFTGLGSKGILMAPMLAMDILEYFAEPASIPKEIRVTYRL